MGFLSRKLRQRDHPSNPREWLLNWFGGGKTASGANVNNYTALNYSALWSCVRVICKAVSTMPLHLYERLDTGGKQRAVKHPLYFLLHSRPNSEMTPLTFKDTLTAHVLTWGNGYAEIEINEKGYPIALWPLTPNRVTPERNKKTSEIQYVVALPGGGTTLLGADQVFHIPGPGFDGVKGYSVLTMFRESVGLGLSLQEYSARFFGNGAAPMGVLEHPDVLKEPAKNYLRDSWNEMHQGLSNAHRVAILEEGMKYHQIGISPEDAQMLESRKFSQLEMASIFQVPPHKVGNLDRATFCLPANAEVYTAEGPKHIVDIRPGELTWSRKDGGGLIISRVRDVIESGRDRILRIATTDRTIRLNSQHRILARRAKERSLFPGETGGRNRDNQKFRVDWVTEYVPAGELRIGDTIVAFNGTSDSGKWETPTRTATVGFMEFCGLYLGGGYMTNGHVTIARAKDALYMDYYREVMRQEFVRYEGGNGRGDKSKVPTVPVAMVDAERYTRFASVKAAAELRNLGMGGTAHEKQVPGWVFDMADELKLAFLRGFLDADGSVDKKGRIAFSSCSKELLSGIRHLCMSLGIPVTNTTERVGLTRLPNGRVSPVHQYAFTCSDPGVNRRIGSHDPRYVNRMETGRPFGRKNRGYPRYGGREFDEPGGELCRIVSIETEAEEFVYDLTVVGTHSFIADGVIVHNTNIEHQAQEFLTDTLLYWLTLWEQTIHWKLLSLSDQARYFAEFLTANLLRGDLKSRYEAYAIGRNTGFLSADDIRSLENLNPLPDGQGKDYWMPLNMRPVNQSGHNTSGDLPKKDIGGENNEA